MDEKLDYVMRYFELHAAQRMSTFNFFIILSGLLISALAKTLESDFQYPSFSVVISLAMMIIAVIFWKLDERVRFLIKHSEDVLCDLEVDENFPPLFRSEIIKTGGMEARHWRGLWGAHLTYSKCFNIVYLLFFVMGIAGLFWVVIRLF